jgi:hypothetical protein
MREEESDVVEDEQALTAYCGLYCRDCIPCRRTLFSLAGDLEAELAGARFEEYARLKTRADAAFADYPAFLGVLRAIRGLECREPCRSGGGKAVCAVRDCVLARGLAGCWDCGESGTCGLLAPLLRFHPNLEHHLDLIRQEGPGAWSAKRRGHYPWQ